MQVPTESPGASPTRKTASATRGRWRPSILLGATLMLCVTGCQQDLAVDTFPAGVLRVRYVPAGDLTDCLVAGTVMCANYVTASDQFSPGAMRDELRAAGLDATHIADVKQWLQGHRLTMTPLSGTLSETRFTGLGWWLLQGGYPVICVVNKFAGNADYNHAVVVIGLDGSGTVETAEGVYVLDPASPRRLERWDRFVFLHYWASAGCMMAPLFETPTSDGHQPVTPGES